MTTMLQDLRYALRQLRKRPGFTVTAILTLAMGIGATTAVFSLVYSILLQPLPYHKSGRLVAIWEEVKYLGADRPYFEANPRHEQYWKQRATYFSDITLLRQGTAGVGQTYEHPRIVGVVLGYTNLLSVLGVEPELGRAFLPEEGTAGHDHVAIITHDLWQRNFAADPHVLGKSLRLNGDLLQIVGVLPESFHFPKGNVLRSQRSESVSWPAIGVVVPLVVDKNQVSFDGDYNFVALGRLKDGVSLQQATTQLNTIDSAILHDYAAASKTKVGDDALRAYLQPLQEAVVGSVSTMLWLLLASVSAVLLIACVNLANLQLSRAISREKELSVRNAPWAQRPFDCCRRLSTKVCCSLFLAALREFCYQSWPSASSSTMHRSICRVSTKWAPTRGSCVSRLRSLSSRGLPSGCCPHSKLSTPILKPRCSRIAIALQVVTTQPVPARGSSEPRSLPPPLSSS